MWDLRRARRPVTTRRRRRNRSRAVLGGQITHHAIHGTTPLAIFRRRERTSRARARAGRVCDTTSSDGVRRASHAGIHAKVRRQLGGGNLDAHVVHVACSDGIVPDGTRIARRCGRGGRRRTRGGSDSARGGWIPPRRRFCSRINAPPPVIRAGRRRVASPRTATSRVRIRAGHGARARRSKPSEALATRWSHAMRQLRMMDSVASWVTGGDDRGISVMRLPETLEDATPSWVSTPLGVLWWRSITRG